MASVPLLLVLYDTQSLKGKGLSFAGVDLDRVVFEPRRPDPA